MVKAQEVTHSSQAGTVGPLRLNLGGAGEGYLNGRIPGFKTVDLRPGNDTDFVADASDLGQFANESVDAIYASQILEHFSHTKTVDVLKEWRRVLKPGAKIYIGVPDFDAAIKLYLKMGLVTWLVYHLWGDQSHPLNYHYVIFTFASLAKALTEAGFSDVKRVKTFDIGEFDGSRSVNTHTLELISLNVIATK